MSAKKAIIWILFAVIIGDLLVIMSGVAACIAAGFMGMDTSGCKGAFKEQIAALLATVIALWAGVNKNDK